jgi:hypothetical protein
VTRPVGGARIVELRGWLRVVGQTPTGDPDWHLDLEVDADWLQKIGADLTTFFKVGDLIRDGHVDPLYESDPPEQPTTPHWAVAVTPVLKAELNAWNSTQNIPRPADWSLSPAAPNTTYWPYDPRFSYSPCGAGQRGAQGVALQPGDYVLISGSLVTDEPHTDGNNPAGEAWQASADRYGQGNPARWSEMHPPDLVQKNPDGSPPPRTSWLRGVAVVVTSGILDTGGQDRELTTAIFPQTMGVRVSPTEWSKLSVQEFVGPETRFGSIIEGNEAKTGAAIRLLRDQASVHVKVHADAFAGAPGKFKAVYLMRWVDGLGKLGHTLRQPNGLWTAFGDVNGQFAIPGPVRAVAAASSAPNVAQFLFATEDGHLWHTIRDANGKWEGLGDVNGQFAIPGPVRAVAAASSAPNVAQFLFATEDGHLWHTIRDANGKWEGLGNASAQLPIHLAPLITQPLNAVRAVAAASSTPGEADFLFCTEDGQLWHTMRHANGTWDPIWLIPLLGPGNLGVQIDMPGVAGPVAAAASDANESQFLFVVD